MHKIVLVGAGQLGSRYLQGLKNVSFPLSIKVVDPSDEALNKARDLWNDTGEAFTIHSVNWVSNLEVLPQEIDLVIVSTTANYRLSVVTELASKYMVRYWVLEKVLAQSSWQLISLRQSLESARGSWVNIPRRMMGWHQILKAKFSSDFPLKMNRRGADWGLACNSIHFIDLAAWWTGELLDSIDVSMLSEKWHESKRSGFYEVFGVLRAKFTGGTILTLEAQAEGEDFGITVDTVNGAWNIDESKGRAISVSGEEIIGSLEFQSSITARLVEKILLQGSCELPTFSESSQMHAILLEHLLMHWNQANDLSDLTLPIT